MIEAVVGHAKRLKLIQRCLSFAQSLSCSLGQEAPQMQPLFRLTLTHEPGIAGKLFQEVILGQFIIGVVLKFLAQHSEMVRQIL